MLQWIRSVIYTVLLFLGTGVFGVIVLVSALLPLTIEQRYVIPRAWGLSLTWLAKVVCGLGYVIEGQENLPTVRSSRSGSTHRCGRRWRRCSSCPRLHGR